MPSPDLPGYVNLRIFDRGPRELVERARVNLQTTLPGFVWRAGSPSAALVETIALMEAERLFAVNRLPGAIFETLAGRLGVAYDQGATPTATVTVTVADAAGYVIVAGTRLRLQLAGDSFVVFTLNADLVVPGGSTSNAVPAPVTGTSLTASANGTAIGTTLAVLDPVPAVDTVVLASQPTGGRGPEPVPGWFARVAARLSRLTETLSVASQFEVAAVDLEPAVVRVKAFDRFDVSLGAGVPGDHPGHISIAVGTDTGAALSGGQKTALEAALEGMARIEVDVHLFDPTITAVEVDVVVERLAAYTSAEVQANVRAALNAYLDPAVWPWAGTVYRFELVSIIDQVEGVSRVVTLTTPAADVVLAGRAPLADFLDTVASTVTVVDPP